MQNLIPYHMNYIELTYEFWTYISWQVLVVNLQIFH